MNRFLKPLLSCVLFAVTFAMTLLPSAQAQLFTPQGRLTLSSTQPVMTTDVTAASTVYYLPYVGNTVPVPNSVGTALANYQLPSTPLSLSLTGTTVVSGELFDIWLTFNSGSLYLCETGPWYDTGHRINVPGSGATDLVQLNGVWVNSQGTGCANGGGGVSMTAKTGTYLGTLYGTGSGTTAMQFNPTPAASGTNNVLGLYNAYNRVKVISNEVDTTASWSDTLGATRPANNSLNNQISYVDGLRQSSPSAEYRIVGQIVGTYNVAVLVNIGSCQSPLSDVFGLITNGAVASLHATAKCSPSLGFTAAQAQELLPNGTGSATFYGKIAGFQSYGLSLEVEM